MTYTDGQIWLVIALLGIGTYLVRLSFLGLIGNRQMPDWVLRHLRPYRTVPPRKTLLPPWTPSWPT